LRQLHLRMAIHKEFSSEWFEQVHGIGIEQRGLFDMPSIGKHEHYCWQDD
jgi:hypothetical protein